MLVEEVVDIGYTFMIGVFHVADILIIAMFTGENNV
jgi:hypothetical protein